MVTKIKPLYEPPRLFAHTNKILFDKQKRWLIEKLYFRNYLINYIFYFKYEKYNAKEKKGKINEIIVH